MLLDLKFSVGTLGIGSGAFVAALYGMNLKNFLEESELGFWGISGVSAAAAAAVCVYGLQKLRRVQRVRMWGEQGRRGARGSWRSLEPPSPAVRGLSGGGGGGNRSGSGSGLPGEGTAERMRRLREEKVEVWRGLKGMEAELDNGSRPGVAAGVSARAEKK